MLDATAPSPEQRIAELECANAALTTRLQEAESTVVRLRRAYTQALEQLQLMHRRLFVAKAERPDAPAEQLVFDALFEQVRRLEKELAKAEAEDEDDPKGNKGNKKRGDDVKPKGRRDLSKTSLPEVRIEVTDPELEGMAERIGVEESSRLGYERGGMRRIVVARVVYKTEPAPVADPSAATLPDATPACTEAAAPAPQPPPTTAPPTGARIVTAPMPKELFRRGLLAPSMIAHILVAKYMMGVPFYRLEQKFQLEHVSLDRGTMCRYAEDAGATLGAIVEAARKDAFAHACCLSTDATGVSLQPGALDERGPRPCRKGHFFVLLADRDYVFFEYQSKHTSAVVHEMFKGFAGYIQADAHAIYDALFAGRPPPGQQPEPTQGPPPIEVGCWSHARRKFWEAAVCKHRLGVEGMKRIDAIFAADRLLADLAPAQRKEQRDTWVLPVVDAFYTWAQAQWALPQERGLVSTALGYAIRQESALRRFLQDGRLRLENNASERALRTVATGRKNWLFFGSDDHASAAGNLFSLIATCKLHGVDPESYLAEVIRVMPYWPRERYLELSPRHWTATRARIDPKELAMPLGPLTVPPEPPKEQSPPR